MVEYSKVNIKLTYTQLKKLKTPVKNNTGTTIRVSLKMFDENDLPHELFLTTRQRTKLRNAFNSNMSTDLELSKAQISKIIQSGGFLGSLRGKLAGPLMSYCSFGKKYFSSFRNNSCCFSNGCMNSKENTWFWNNNFNNFKQRHE